MNAYDFDGTIYNGDSSMDFLMFLMKKKPLRSLLRIPLFARSFFAYKSGTIKKEVMKEVFFSLILMFDNREEMIGEFWKSHKKNIKKFYYETRKDDDVIISASPEFLIRPVADEFGFTLIASPIDLRTGRYTGINCHGEEKIRRLKEIYGDDVVIEDFYSDSLVDLPMAKFAKRAFMVNGDRITEWIF